MLLVWWDLPNVMGILELDSLQRLHDTLPWDRFELMAISLDGAGYDSLVYGFAINRGWNCPVLRDSARTAATAYGLVNMPTTVLVGTDTTIVYRQHGFYEGDKEAIELQVRQWLR